MVRVIGARWCFVFTPITNLTVLLFTPLCGLGLLICLMAFFSELRSSGILPLAQCVLAAPFA